MDPFSIGRIVGPVIDQEPTRILCYEERMRPHVSRPWFRKYLRRQHGIAVTSRPPTGTREAIVQGEAIERHCLCTGPTGTGKSRLLEVIILHLLQNGCSVCMVEPKMSMLTHVLAHARRLGIAPEAVRLLDPQSPLIPGFNPLLAGGLGQTAGDLVSLLENNSTSWGVRLDDVLTNAFLLAGAHGLSILEVVRMLTDDDYRSALLAYPHAGTEGYAVAEARRFFAAEFAAWNRTERANAVAPALRRLREFLRNQALRPLLTARRNTVDFPGLWQRQGLVLAHVEASALGDAGARLLAGMLASGLFRTAMRTSGPVPVVLVVDELSLAERLVGRTICDILAVGRSQNLVILAACQHLDQLSPELRASLLTNPGVKAFFRQGPADARLAAATLATSMEARVQRLSVEADTPRTEGDPVIAQLPHAIRNASGQRLRLDPGSWSRVSTANTGTARLAALMQVCREAGAPRLYVNAADTGDPAELRAYLAGVPASDFTVSGPAPLRLIVGFPRPKVGGVERLSEGEAQRQYARRLLQLPMQHAVLSLLGKEAGLVRVADVPDPEPSPELDAYVQAVREAGGQSAAEIADVASERERRIELLRSGRPIPPETEASDGSIA